MYTKTSWLARVGTALNRFLFTDNGDGSMNLTADTTGITTNGTPISATNLNKIETGIYDAHVNADANDSRLETIEPKVTTLEGTGTPQGVGTSDSPTFATVNTGQGANELYPMNQDVKSTASPTFASVNTGYGANEVYKVSRETIAFGYGNNITKYVSAMVSGETRHVNATGTINGSSVYDYHFKLKLPSGGSYDVIVTRDKSDDTYRTYCGLLGGGDTIADLPNEDDDNTYMDLGIIIRKL